MHNPFELDLSEESPSTLFDEKENFLRLDKAEYQPFFAFLERNGQKYQQFKVSLGISGLWFEQAKRWDPELLDRLKRQINLGHVQLVALPYDYSLSWFYDTEEFTAEIQRFKNQIQGYFGVECEILAMPELMYNDKIGEWADRAGFSGILIAGADGALDWRHPNRVFESKKARNLRILVNNSRISRMISEKQGEVLVEPEKKTVDTPDKIFSTVKLLRELDLEFVQGELVNICLNTEIFDKYRQFNIIKFFDLLVATWLDDPRNRFYGAHEVIGSLKPSMVLSVKSTTSWRKTEVETKPGIVLSSKAENSLPEWANSEEQVRVQILLYAMREQVLATKDEDLYRDFGRLSALDYVLGFRSGSEGMKNTPSTDDFLQILENFEQIVQLKMPQPVKLEAKAGPGRIEIPEEKEDFSVTIKRVKPEKKPRNQIILHPQEKVAEEAKEDAEPDIKINIEKVSEAEVVEKSAKKPKAKKRLHKLAIE